MTNQGYREDDLVKNRTAVMLIGGSEADRRAWAEEAASYFPGEGAVREVTEEAHLSAALAQGRGVVFIPDTLALGINAQGSVLRCLQYQEERPKLVLGVPGDPAEARASGALREDLHYRLHLSLVDLATPGLREVMRVRRNKAEAERKVQAARAEAAAKKLAAQKKATVTRTIPAKYPGGAGASVSSAVAPARKSGPSSANVLAARAPAAAPRKPASNLVAQRSTPAVASPRAATSPGKASTPPGRVAATRPPAKALVKSAAKGSATPARARPAMKKAATAPARGSVKAPKSRRDAPRRPTAGKTVVKKPSAKKAPRK